MSTTRWRIFSVFIVLCIMVLLTGACGGGDGNQAPVITRLTGDSETVSPGKEVVITCVARDTDGDVLNYSWTASGGSIRGSGDVSVWTAPDASGTYAIDVIVADGRGGTDNEQYEVKVVAPGANQPPVIERISANLDSVEPERNIILTCEASDPDGDSLTYSWWAPLGHFLGEGNVVTYVASRYPDEYEVEVHVRDRRGGNAVDSITVIVASNEPPKISRVDVEPEVVLTDYSAEITCKAEDPDGDPLTYEWSATGGTLTGSGDTVTWTAPGRASYYTIEVNVDDGRGGSDTDSITIQVEGLKIATRIKPASQESGAVKSDGTVLTLWTVGDDSVDNGIRTLLSFNISRVESVEEFRSAKLVLSTLDLNGTPWADLGDLLIDEVTYGERELEDDDYELDGDRIERFAAAPLAEMDVTQLIKRALTDEETRFQIMVFFHSETDADGTADNIKVSAAELQLYYVAQTN